MGISHVCIAQADDDSYFFVGAGWCRHVGSAGCSTLEDKCKVNGYFKDDSSESECRTRCDSDSECIGYAISADTYSVAPERCFVHTKVNHTPTGWEAYNRDYFSIEAASGLVGISCYRYQSWSQASARCPLNKLRQVYQCSRVCNMLVGLRTCLCSHPCS